MRWLKWLIWGRDLRRALNETKKIKVCGIFFKIRKIQVLDVLDGSKVLLSSYQTYEESRQKGSSESLEKKLKDHYKDVFMSSVISPELSRDKSEVSKIFVEHLFTDFDLADELYDKIMLFTYGKKKIKKARKLQRSYRKLKSKI